jgi:hypothetical protein
MAIESLFGLGPAEVQELRRKQSEEEIAASGKEFGVFAPLYRAGLRFGEKGSQAMGQLMGVKDPLLEKATMVQGVLAKYADQDMTSPLVLGEMAKEFASMGATKEAMVIAQEARNAAMKQEQIDIQRESVGISRDKLQLELEDAVRKNKLTEAQIREIDARIANVRSENYMFQVQKDVVGNPTGVIAINKTNPKDVQIIPFTAPGPAAPAAGAGTDKKDKKDRRPLGVFGSKSGATPPSTSTFDMGL